MKILLTGSDGFTGKPFAEYAVSLGHEIVALQSNLTSREELFNEIKEATPDAVVHLAAISFVGHADEKEFYAINVLGTTNLLDALVQLKVAPSKVLLASSANIYGNTDQSPIVETLSPAPVNHYAMSKLAMEYMARTYQDRLRLVITRPFNYTGPGQDRNFIIPKLAFHFAHRKPSIALGNLNVEREFNDVQLVCSAYMELLNHGEPGETYNVCSGQPYELQSIIDKFSSLTGHSLKVRIDSALVRANEVHRLCGNPAKLTALLAKRGRLLDAPPIESTLRRMLLAENASALSTAAQEP
ncbi:GDP-mannose 4,6-dehydratase [Variovorax sp. J22R133]|uniref:GDP-mannose 4,6-dehydratase n=1 Tax=Variovorax brevis TaxID=3053503 RepID=UPI002578FE87|nr:GDP-mannose 4,6-dehydratase [Variovorax sp. J22R133]MDM0114688.1 GDP-mannose 4,6-dehydratase [Variovorax sp. J22R133]